MKAPHSLAQMRAAIIAAFPELEGSRFERLQRGWDSQAVDVDDRLIFKFPRHEAALGRLRKEVRVLSVIRPRVSLPVPDIALFETPQPFTRHEKLAGDHMPPERYAAMTNAGKVCVARQLAVFYAEIHAIDDREMAAAGAGPIGPWLEPGLIADRALPHLPAALRARAEAALKAYAALPPDPLGTTYGFFDGHGWNMAFDPAAERLKGVYDFGDSGFGPLHQEFIYSNLCDFDLTERIVTAYERLTRRSLDRERIHLLTAIHGLSELAEDADTTSAVKAGVARFGRWAARAS